MTFAEKLKTARKNAGMTQRKLAEESHVALRTIANYESGERMPKKEETFDNLARALGITVESLKDEHSDFLVKAEKRYGGKGRKQAEEIIRSFRVAAAGGELDDEDLEFIKEAMMQTYWDAKRYNRRFTNKRYQEENSLNPAAPEDALEGSAEDPNDPGTSNA